MIYFKIKTSLSDQPIIVDTMSITSDPPHSVYVTNWFEYWQKSNIHSDSEVKRFVKNLPWHIVESIEIIKGV